MDKVTESTQEVGAAPGSGPLTEAFADADFAAPFRGVTLPPLEVEHGRRDTLVRRSREKCASCKREAEDKIKRWLER